MPDVDPPDRGEPTAGDRRLVIGPGAAIDPGELQWRFMPSGGPGGQHANRANTRVELRFDIAASPSLTEAQRDRLIDRLGEHVRVVCDQERSQVRNRALARERLIERLAGALRRDAPRRPTRVSRGAKQRRLEQKKRRSATKRDRQWKPTD